MQKLNGAMLEGISSEERLLLRRLLLQIEQNLETAEDCSRGRKERRAMLKIFKYMKHSALSVVCILLLLFIQA